MSVRSIETDGSMDEILLQGMRFYGYHGVNPEEQTLGQRFVVDLAVSADLREAGRSDDLSSTISYSAVFKVVRPIVEEQRFDLLEALAESVAAAILHDFELAEGVKVTVRKPGVAIKGAILDAAGVRIHRRRNRSTS
jgi:dihydroneopterin aldolase